MTPTLDNIFENKEMIDVIGLSSTLTLGINTIGYDKPGDQMFLLVASLIFRAGKQPFVRTKI